MKIASVESFPVRAPLAGFETALVKVALEDGAAGWGEAQASVAPEVACQIIERLLAPVLIGKEFDGGIARIEQLWAEMYSSMRLHGQTSGFMLDAVSGVDIALWDLAGKQAGQPVSDLLGAAKPFVPAYLSGIQAVRAAGEGFRTVKLHYDGDQAALLRNVDAMRERFDVAVDAQWRFEPDSAAAFGRELDARGVLWFECPLPPEDPLAHAAIARRFRTPVAIGESYHTQFELAPFLREGALKILQPDLGRTGITEGLRIARAAANYGIPVIPHIGTSLGPRIAAAIHFAAAVDCNLLAYNPAVLEAANRSLRAPIEIRNARYAVPREAGLGIDLKLL